ncbi:MAG: hypothetical protein NT167_13830 [Verrucomicrobia bacterium]|nr:hypothetical protein [Verrucomicrobiota bacterium]
MHLPKVEINGVAQRLESEERDAHREQVMETKRHEGRRVRQLYRQMHPREDRVQVLGDETGVFEEEQQRQVVDQADQ